MVTKADGNVHYEHRSAEEDVPLEQMNLKEKERFMNGDKEIAFISEAASSGISLRKSKVIAVLKINVVACTSLWNCLGVLTAPSNNLVCFLLSNCVNIF